MLINPTNVTPEQRPLLTYFLATAKKNKLDVLSANTVFTLQITGKDQDLILTNTLVFRHGTDKFNKVETYYEIVASPYVRTPSPYYSESAATLYAKASMTAIANLSQDCFAANQHLARDLFNEHKTRKPY